MENPLDKAGDAVGAAGEALKFAFHGIARFLEQVTGDAFSAAAFAFFLFFSIWLLRNGATVRNVRLYAFGLIAIGIGGMLIIGAISYEPALQASSQSLPTSTDDEEYLVLLSKGLGQSVSNTAANSDGASGSAVGFNGNRWYFLVLGTMILVGSAILIIAKWVAPLRKQDVTNQG